MLPPPPKVRKMSGSLSDLRYSTSILGITPQPIKVQPVITNTRILQLFTKAKADSYASCSPSHTPDFGGNISSNETIPSESSFECQRDNIIKDMTNFRNCDNSWQWT